MGDSKPVTLPTKDHDEAYIYYQEYERLWSANRAKMELESLEAKITASATGVEEMTFSAYAKKWRETYLPTLLKANGQPISEKTRSDYARMLKNQVESDKDLMKIWINQLKVAHFRNFLKKWVHSPAFYNYIKSLLSRVVQSAVPQAFRPAPSTPARQPVVPRPPVLGVAK